MERIDLKKEINRSNRLFDNLAQGKINLENIEESTTSERVTNKFKEINQWSEDRELFVKEEFQEKQEAKVEVRVIIPPKYHN
jgi:predicted amino acid-binding ACT domain protein